MVSLNPFSWFRKSSKAVGESKGVSVNGARPINLNLDLGEDWLEKGGADSVMPFPVDTFVQMAGTSDKTPMFQFSWRWLYNTYYNSDLLYTIIKVITDETFKNGIEIKERYASKCLKCGREFAEDTPICPYDFSITVKPDYEEYKRLKEFVSKSNSFDEDLLTTMKIVDNDVNIGDNGWILVVKEYLYNENGKLLGADVKEVVRLSPAKMRMIFSKYGMGIDDNGNYLYFCPEHRDEAVKVDKPGVYYCPKCGREMLRAWYMAKDGAKDIYYAKEEIYHVKRWSNVQGYGVSPLISVWMKVLTLMKMDRFILEAYSLQRSPKALLIIRGKLDSFRKAWEWLMQKSRENPNMIYPLVIEGGEETAGKRIVEYQAFDLKPEEWSWLEMRKEFRETVGLVYGVQPMFVQGVSGSGLQNEGLQIGVTNRTVYEGQRVWNGFLEWLSDSILGCHSYVLKLVPNEQEDELRLLDIENKRLDIASRLKNEFGMEIELYRDSRGLLAFRYKRVDKGGAKNGKVDEYIRGLEAKVNEMGDIDESKLQ